MAVTRSQGASSVPMLRGRKRGSSLTSTSAGATVSQDCSSDASHSSAALTANTRNAEPSFSVRTPRKAKKRVRFSDPGPRLQDSASNDGCTGLTPAFSRTSFEEMKGASDGGQFQEPTRRLQPRSTPMLRSRRSLDSALPLTYEHSSEHLFQWTPLRQILDARTQRRIRRVGLSDEVTQIERDKRDAAKLEKILTDLRQQSDAQNAEIIRLRHELEIGTFLRSEEDAPSLADDITTPSSPSETSCFTRTSSNSTADSPADCGNSAEGIFMTNNSGIDEDLIMTSSSPDLRSSNDCQIFLHNDNFSLLRESLTADVSVQASMPDEKQEAEFLAVTRDLDKARREKQELFHAWRTRISSLDGNVPGDDSRSSSPPPDFPQQVIRTLTDALTRASDAAHALDTVRQELSALGFAGANVDAIVVEMQSCFRTARLELERAVPGETANAALTDGYVTLRELVKRVRILVTGLEDEKMRHQGALGREKALRGQFNALLSRYEIASRKVRDLEESIASSAADMLHTRMRMQELECEGKQQAFGIDRLNSALAKYRDEVKSLEVLVTSLEKEKVSCKAHYKQQISALQHKLSASEESRLMAQSRENEHQMRIRELDEIVQRNRIRVCDLTAQVESLEKEREEAMGQMEQQAAQEFQRHETEIGSMNVRISELTTTLEETKLEMERLRQINAGLEEQLNLEIQAKDEILDSWVAHQARASAYVRERVNTERRKSKVRSANWKLQSDEILSDEAALGSEPITPVSMTRFVDVEVGRGKSRRRLNTMDSGIGILTEEELPEDERVFTGYSDPW